MKYEGPEYYQSKDMANVSFCRQTNGRTGKQMGKKIYAPDLSMQGHENEMKEVALGQYSSTFVFFSKIYSFERNTTSDWLNHKV